LPTLHENIPPPDVRAVLAMPLMLGDSQSAVPSSRTTHFWSCPQRTCSQGSFAHWPMAFTQTFPATQPIPAHGRGLQVPVVASQKDSNSHVARQADFTHAPLEQVRPAPQVRPAQLGTHAPALQN
jgi:hypothetical protein